INAIAERNYTSCLILCCRVSLVTVLRENLYVTASAAKIRTFYRLMQHHWITLIQHSRFAHESHFFVRFGRFCGSLPRELHPYSYGRTAVQPPEGIWDHVLDPENGHGGRLAAQLPRRKLHVQISSRHPERACGPGSQL